MIEPMTVSVQGLNDPKTRKSKLRKPERLSAEETKQNKQFA